MDWKAQKRACDEAARSHAEGGENQTELYRRRGLIERYQNVYAARREEIEATEAKEAQIAPLRDISNELDALLDRADSSEVRELGYLVQRLVEHMLEKDNG